MILPPGDQSLMTFLFVAGVTRLSLFLCIQEVVFYPAIDVNYMSNGSRDTLPLIITSNDNVPLFQDLITTRMRLIVHLWPTLL